MGTVANGRHACAMESGAPKMSPPLSALGKNTAFCDRRKNLLESSHHDFHIGHFWQQACMIYIINKLFSRASSVLVTINSPIHRKVPKNGKPLAAACCSLLGKKKNICRIFVCRIPSKYHSVSSTLQLLQPEKTAPNN